MFLYRPFSFIFRVFRLFFVLEHFSYTQNPMENPSDQRKKYKVQDFPTLLICFLHIFNHHLFVFISFVLVHFSCFYCIFCSFYCLSFFLYRLREIFSITFFELLRPILRFRGRWLMYNLSNCQGFDISRFDTWFLTWPCLLLVFCLKSSEVKI